MDITKEKFEKHVPAFTDATEEVFAKIGGAIEHAKFEITMLFGDGYEQKVLDANLAERAVCLMAAYDSVAQLDLVLTPTGFGIVRNDHLTPASRERTEALKDQLRKQKSDSIDILLNHLLNTEWRESAAAISMVDQLLYCPAMFRRYGVSYENRAVYREEMELLAVRTTEATAKIEKLISPELYQDLCTKQRDVGKMSTEEKMVLETARKTLAVYIVQAPAPYAAEQERKLLRQLESFADQLPAYKNSSTYAAYHLQRYENKKEDPTFFFG